ncbi:MAG TPA: hypothetical protein VFC73_08400 [Syntrophomonadaceae bacterium]|nr:hypothetical protein [Syntrophomonadaceae bacterium]
MLNLDFAFLNLINKDKKGLASQKYFLEKLTPIFFKPRLEKLIDLRNVSLKGCNISVPLGINNFQMLNQDLQNDLLDKSFNIVNEYGIHYMAVDRKLKLLLRGLTNYRSLVFGDNFIKALANVVIADTLNKHSIKKIIIIGETERFEDFLEVITSYELPLSLQNQNPHYHEKMTYRMLYERGCAVSNSYISPDEWGEKDIIINFDQGDGQLSISSPDLYYFEFANNKVNLAPKLEEKLGLSGIEPNISSLAPILETSLWRKAGFLHLGEEQSYAKELINGKAFLTLQKTGDRWGLWDQFLDNGIWGLYNTLKTS